MVVNIERTRSLPIYYHNHDAFFLNIKRVHHSGADPLVFRVFKHPQIFGLWCSPLSEHPQISCNVHQDGLESIDINQLAKDFGARSDIRKKAVWQLGNKVRVYTVLC